MADKCFLCGKLNIAMLSRCIDCQDPLVQYDDNGQLHGLQKTIHGVTVMRNHGLAVFAITKNGDFWQYDYKGDLIAIKRNDKIIWSQSGGDIEDDTDEDSDD